MAVNLSLYFRLCDTIYVTEGLLELREAINTHKKYDKAYTDLTNCLIKYGNRDTAEAYLLLFKETLNAFTKKEIKEKDEVYTNIEDERIKLEKAILLMK